MSAVSAFADRRSAGERLAQAVRRLGLSATPLVLAVPSGGVPVGAAVARALNAPLDVLTVRRITLPGQPQATVGAIAAGDVVVHEPAIGASGATDAGTFARLVLQERPELYRREQRYRGGQHPLDPRGRTVVLVDDGLVTGATMLAAVRAARRAGAAGVVVAAPVAADAAARVLGKEADRLVILKIVKKLASLAEWYTDFGSVEDTLVEQLLREARETARA